MRLGHAILLTVLLLGLTGCSSNRGKLVGKWEATSATSKEMRDGLTFTMEFAEDGAFTFLLTDREKTMTYKGRYSLGMGDTISLKDIEPPLNGRTTSTELISISEDRLTLKSTSRDKTMTLVFKRL
jgi:hypothetical protein